MRPARILFLHGLGDTPHGWAETLREAFGTRLAYVTFELPEAPKARVTCNGGMVMTSWMDLHDIPVTPGAFDDEPTITRSVEIVHRAVDKAIEGGIPPERVVIGGFSQGAALAFISTLRYSQRLGGCVMLSGWPPFVNTEPIAQSANAKTVRRRAARAPSQRARRSGASRASARVAPDGARCAPAGRTFSLPTA